MPNAKESIGGLGGGGSDRLQYVWTGCISCHATRLCIIFIQHTSARKRWGGGGAPVPTSLFIGVEQWFPSSTHVRVAGVLPVYSVVNTYMLYMLS